MNPYVGLLFNQGHLHDPALVRALAAEPAPAAPVAPEDECDAPPQAPPRCSTGAAGTVRRRGWVALCCATALSMFR